MHTKKPGDYWGFLTRLRGMPTEEIRVACQSLVHTYCEDLQEHLDDELVQFIAFCCSLTNDLSPRMLILKEKQLQCAFPNVEIALSIFLILPVSDASGERSLSKLDL